MLDYTASGFTFDFEAKVVSVESSITSVVVQDFINTIRTSEASSLGMSYNKIADASGKDSLGGVVQTGITLTLLNNWQLKFDDRTGPNFTQCIVSNGNLVGGINDNPIKASNYTQINVLRSQAGVLVTGGSAITPTDKYDITHGVWSDSGTSALTSVTASVDNVLIAETTWETSASSYKNLTNTMGKYIYHLFKSEFGKWEMTNNQLVLYDDADPNLVISRFNLYDINGNPSLTGVVKKEPVIEP